MLGAPGGHSPGQPMHHVAACGDMGKVFIGGLSRETSTETLKAYFERFGAIADCVVMKDRSTGAPRGFGFVTYVSQQVAENVVLHRHVIDGKEVEAKHAVPREAELAGGPRALDNRPAPLQLSQMGAAGQGPLGHSPMGHMLSPMSPMASPGLRDLMGSNMGGGLPGGLAGGVCGQPLSSCSSSHSHSSGPGSNESAKKVFVGGLSHETTEAEFVQYFSMYGSVVDCVIMCDPNTRKPRGFGFITYDSLQSVDRVCQQKYHELNGAPSARPRARRPPPPARAPRCSPRTYSTPYTPATNGSSDGHS